MREMYQPTLSRNAYERFCENFKPCDFEACRRFVLSPLVRKYAACGASRVRIPKHDMAVALKNGTVTTVWRLSENPTRVPNRPLSTRPPGARS